MNKTDALARYKNAQMNYNDARDDARPVKIALVAGIVAAALVPVFIALCAVLASFEMSALSGGAGGLIGFSLVVAAGCLMFSVWDVNPGYPSIPRIKHHISEVRKAERALNEAAEDVNQAQED